MKYDDGSYDQYEVDVKRKPYPLCLVDKEDEYEVDVKRKPYPLCLVDKEGGVESKHLKIKIEED